MKSAMKRRHAPIVKEQGVTNVLGVILASRMNARIQYAVTVRWICMVDKYAIMVGAGSISFGNRFQLLECF